MMRHFKKCLPTVPPKVTDFHITLVRNTYGLILDEMTSKTLQNLPYLF